MLLPPEFSSDPQGLEELRLAVEAKKVLGEHGWPVKLWLVLRLARTEGGRLHDAVERMKALPPEGPCCFLGGPLTDSIVRTREDLGRWVREVEEFVCDSQFPIDEFHRELIVALLVRDHPVEITKEMIHRGAREAEALLAAWNQPPSLPDGVNPGVLEDLLHVKDLLSAAVRTSARIEVWEVFRLALEDRETLDRAADRLRDIDPADALNVDLIRFCRRLRELRAREGERVRALRRYVAGLPIGKYGADSMELAYGLILASPEGSARVDQWLEDPERHRREAAIRVEGVIGRAQKYLQALRCLCAAGSPS